MMNRFRWLAACVAAGIGVAAWAQKVDFKINYEPGAYVITHTTTMTESRNINGQWGKSQTSMVATTDMTVGKADANGKREVTFTVRHLKYETSMGDDKVMKYDSAADTAPQDRHTKQLNAFIDKTISMTVDSKGQADNVVGIDAIFDAMGTVPTGNARDKYTKEFRDSLISGLVQPVASPTKPVSKDDSWTADSALTLMVGKSIPVTQTYTLTEIKNDVATVTSKATVNEAMAADTTAAVDCTMHVDVATGLTTSATVALKITIIGGDNVKEVTGSMIGTLETTIKKGTYEAAKEKEAPKNEPTTRETRRRQR